MKLLHCFYVLSGIVAAVHGGRDQDEKLLDEEPVAETTFSRFRRPYDFEQSSLIPPTYDFLSFTPREERPRFRQRKPNRNRNPTETNELTNGEQDLLAFLFRDDYDDKRVAFLRRQQHLEDDGNGYDDGDVRKKREASPNPEASPTGKLRMKRTYCKKCGGGYGGGGHGGYPTAVVPVYQVAVPVYGGYGGGHKPSYGGGCTTCGQPVYGGYKPSYGGHVPSPPVYGGYKPSYGGGCNTCGSPGFGGGGGSYSHSSSQSSSSSSSWGYGKK